MKNDINRASFGAKKKRFLTGKFFLQFLFVLTCALACVNEAWGDINWLAQGATPVAGKSYYIYNATHNYFVTYTSTASTASVAMDSTATPSKAKLFTFEAGTGDSLKIYTIDKGTRKYVYSHNIVPNAGDYTANYGKSCYIQDGDDTGGYETYYIVLPTTTSTRTYMLDEYSAANRKPYQSYRNWKGRNWIFIPDDAVTLMEEKTFYGRYEFITDEDKRGALFMEYGLMTASKYHYARASESRNATVRAEEAQLIAVSIEAYPKRGYRFKEWEVSSNISFYGYTKYDSPNSVQMTATSEDEENPTISTVQAIYEEDPELLLTIQKIADLGHINVSYHNLLDYNGSYMTYQTVNMTTMTTSATSQDYTVYNSDKVYLTAVVDEEGYAFYGWYLMDEDGNKTLYSSEASVTLSHGINGTIYAHFGKELTEDDKFIVGQNPCHTLADAISVAISSPSEKTIRLLQDYTVPAGNYNIPAGITLLIPYSVDQEEPDVNIQRTINENIPTDAFRTLTLAAGAHLNVYGTIEVGGKQSIGSKDVGGDVGVGRPAAPTYGLMVLNEGSSITLNNGAIFRAWGFVQGQGEIDARRGSTVREQFQMMDWRGYNLTSRMFNSHKVLPMTQYYIQNIESPTIYHPGAKLLTCAGVRATVPDIPLPINAQMDTVGIIGARYSDSEVKDDAAIFLMDNEDDSEDTWVRKYYDPTTDRQVYEVNNAAYLGSLELTFRAEIMGGFKKTVNSAEYVLPITNNFKIHLLNGEMIVTQNTVMLPGSEIELDKQSTVTIPDTASLYFYDTDQWDKYVCGHFVNETTYQFTYASRIKYRPGGVPGNDVRDISSAAALGNAKLNVHGTVNVEGQLFTTEGGASIISTKEDAGTILFTNGAPAFSTDHYVEQVSSTTPTYVKAQCVSALLTNEAGSSFGEHTATAETAAGKSFCFIDINEDGKCEWISLTDDEEVCAVHDQGGVYYIKPNKYVPISSGIPTEEADHTYRDHYAGTDSIYIHTADCQWWCVYPVAGHPDLFECRHKDNHTIYYYDEFYENWMEKKFKVEWVNWDGSPVKYKPKSGDSINYYMVTYGTVPQWLSANPTRPDNANYSYTFTGWSPAFSPVTNDVKYVAQYTETPRMFLVSFKNAAGVELETTSYEYLTMPTPPTEGVDLETYQWSPAISAVTGNQIYQLVAKPSKFTVTYKNWDGTVLQTTSDITSGTATPTAPTATKNADVLYSYTFNGWSPSPAATVTADAIYTATYTRGPRTYNINFYRKDGSTKVCETQNLAYGATPTLPTNEQIWRTKEGTEWDSTLVWSPVVGPVTGAQNYVATYTRKKHQYTVTWKNYDGSTITTDYVDYGATPAFSGLTPKKEDADKIYTFTGWSPAIATVAANQVYTAQFDEGHLKTVEVAVNGTNSTSGHVETLILNASENGSGQLTGNITATTAYYDLKFTDGTKRHWHSFGVPWQVNLDTDPLTEVETGRTFVLGRDYDIMYYNTAKRAAQGPGSHCWEYVEHHAHILQPGQGYMIAFVCDVQTLRFAKKANSPVIFNGTMNVTAEGSGDDQGINAIANPMAYKATLAAGPTVGYVHDGGEIGSDGYEEYNIEDKSFIVGKAVYIQVRTPGSVAIALSDADQISPTAAPARRAARATDKEYLSLSDYYHVSIASEKAQGGSVYVLPEEDKVNEYVVGHDLAKFGMNSTKPQLWVNRYDVKLGLNTTAPMDGIAEYPISVYAPAAGEYTLHHTPYTGNDDYVVYLTQNGEAIWNLSESAYSLNLNAGVNKTYGLRLSAHKAPTVVTGVDEAVVDAQGETRKVLINDHVYIIRGNQVYSVDGQLVK